jgi:hypothetical protein
MKLPKKPIARGRRTSDQSRGERKQQSGIEKDHLLQEVQEANDQVSDPAERKRVIPSRPC